MSKMYIIEKEYEKGREKEIYLKLEEIREKNITPTFMEDIKGIRKRESILMKKPSGCLIELTKFYRDGMDTGRIIVAITAVKDDKPKIVETLEKLLEQPAKIISLKSILYPKL